jgi:hypothetical protein
MPVSFRLTASIKASAELQPKAVTGPTKVTCDGDAPETCKVGRIDAHSKDTRAVRCAPRFDALRVVRRARELDFDSMFERCADRPPDAKTSSQRPKQAGLHTNSACVPSAEGLNRQSI